jgi:hypothetical protein
LSLTELLLDRSPTPKEKPMKSRLIRITQKNYLRLQKIAKRFGPPAKGFRYTPDQVLTLVLEEMEKRQKDKAS